MSLHVVDPAGERENTTQLVPRSNSHYEAAALTLRHRRLTAQGLSHGQANAGDKSQNGDAFTPVEHWLSIST